MALKSHYQVRESLDKSYLDHPINPTGNSDGVTLYVKQILVAMGVFLITLWMVTKSFVASAGPVFIILVILWFLAAGIYFARTTNSGQLVASRVLLLSKYLPTSARRVVTRSTSDPRPMARIVGVDEISPEGLIQFYGKRVGQMYKVSGSASALLFEEDRDALIVRYGKFLRKFNPDVTIHILTAKAPQNVDSQIANLERRSQQLGPDDDDLRELLDKQYQMLSNFVGQEFRSLHQYMLVVGQTTEALRVAHTEIESELANSGSSVFRDVALMDDVETIEVLQQVYRGR